MSEEPQSAPAPASVVPPSSIKRRARIAELRRKLAHGAGSPADRDELREVLGLPGGADDHEVAAALVEAIASEEIDAVDLSTSRRSDPRLTLEPPPVSATTSLLGRVAAGRDDAIQVDRIDDLRTLVGVLRGGTLRQRRAAARRLREKLEKGGSPSDRVRHAIAAIEQTRDMEIAYELAAVRTALPGAAGRGARGDSEQWRKDVTALEQALVAFWDGETAIEPIGALPGDQRVQLLIRVRDLSDSVVAHLGAVIEGADGASDRKSRLALLQSMRFAGDPRLVPSLRAVVDESDRELVIEAARALASIDDPRVRHTLLAAYERSVVDAERAVLAGALGHVGDTRGASYVRKLLDSDDNEVVRHALEALESVGTADDCERVGRLLDQGGPLVVAQAVRTLGRIGDGRALGAVAKLRDKTSVAVVWAEIEDAELAVRARMEVRGEEAPEPAVASRALAAASKAALARDRARVVVRLKSWHDFMIGHLWLLVGGFERALARFEAAATRRERWGRPLVSIAMAHARRDQHPQALAAFRRAVEADPGAVERLPHVVHAFAQCFLRRAEEMERDGRMEIAQGLLEEVLALDLRRAPTAIRFEVRRRRDALGRVRGAA